MQKPTDRDDPLMRYDDLLRCSVTVPRHLRICSAHESSVLAGPDRSSVHDLYTNCSSAWSGDLVVF